MDRKTCLEKEGWAKSLTPYLSFSVKPVGEFPEEAGWVLLAELEQESKEINGEQVLVAVLGGLKQNPDHSKGGSQRLNPYRRARWSH